MDKHALTCAAWRELLETGNFAAFRDLDQEGLIERRLRPCPTIADRKLWDESSLKTFEWESARVSTNGRWGVWSLCLRTGTLLEVETRANAYRQNQRRREFYP